MVKKKKQTQSAAKYHITVNREYYKVPINNRLKMLKSLCYRYVSHIDLFADGLRPLGMQFKSIIGACTCNIHQCII